MHIVLEHQFVQLFAKSFLTTWSCFGRFVACEYEKMKNLAATALAFKCVEVPYLKTAYCKKHILSRDLQEFQTALYLLSRGWGWVCSIWGVLHLKFQFMILFLLIRVIIVIFYNFGLKVFIESLPAYLFTILVMLGFNCCWQFIGVLHSSLLPAVPALGFFKSRSGNRWNI